jgi:hypothetical protein
MLQSSKTNEAQPCVVSDGNITMEPMFLFSVLGVNFMHDEQFLRKIDKFPFAFHVKHSAKDQKLNHLRNVVFARIKFNRNSSVSEIKRANEPTHCFMRACYLFRVETEKKNKEAWLCC